MSSRHEKLVNRLLSKPTDFRWNEAVRLLDGFEFRQAKGGKTAGSVVRFEHAELGVIIVHKPHPGSILKPYAIRSIIRQLKEKDLI